MDSLALSRLIEAKLLDGSLPVVSGTVMGGVSGGRRCAICNEDIQSGQLEIEVFPDGPNAIGLHPLCHIAYRRVVEALHAVRIV